MANSSRHASTVSPASAQHNVPHLAHTALLEKAWIQVMSRPRAPSTTTPVPGASLSWAVWGEAAFSCGIMYLAAVGMARLPPLCTKALCCPACRRPLLQRGDLASLKTMTPAASSRGKAWLRKQKRNSLWSRYLGVAPTSMSWTMLFGARWIAACGGRRKDGPNQRKRLGLSLQLGFGGLPKICLQPSLRQAWVTWSGAANVCWQLVGASLKKVANEWTSHRSLESFHRLQSYPHPSASCEKRLVSGCLPLKLTLNIQWTYSERNIEHTLNTVQKAANSSKSVQLMVIFRKKHKFRIFFRFPPIRSFPQFSQCSMPRSLHVQCTFNVRSLWIHSKRVVPVVTSI